MEAARFVPLTFCSALLRSALLCSILFCSVLGTCLSLLCGWIGRNDGLAAKNNRWKKKNGQNLKSRTPRQALDELKTRMQMLG